MEYDRSFTKQEALGAKSDMALKAGRGDDILRKLAEATTSDSHY